MIARLAPLAVVAVAATAAGCGSESRAKPFAIDEKAGTIGKVALGDSRAGVVSALGKPGEAGAVGFLPLGEYFEEIGGPPSFPVPNRGEVLRYDHFAALLIGGRVFAMIASGNARTTAGPGIGDSLATVKRAFSHPSCTSYATEDRRDIPSCSFPVRAGRISFGNDPVKSITLVAPRNG